MVKLITKKALWIDSLVGLTLNCIVHMTKGKN